MVAETIRQPAEISRAAELAALRAYDRWPKPPGWQLSPRLVETFILGSPESLPGPDGKPVAITPKFVGDRRLVQVAIATLASDRALMLTGQPGTAKCLKFDTWLVDTRTGERLTIEEACRRRDLSVASLGDDLHLHTQRAIDYLDNGVSPCYRVTTALGRQIEVTINHPFLTLEGWRPLAELAPGSRIALPRELPYFGDQVISDAHVKVLAHLIAEGCLTRSVPYFSNTNPLLQADFTRAVTAAFPDLSAHWYPDGRDCSVSGGRRGPWASNPCTRWLERLGLMGCDSSQKSVPESVFTLPRRQIALFLNRLFSGDGFVHKRTTTGQIVVDYSTKSKRLIQDVQHLLLRFGINAAVKQLKSGHFRLFIQGAGPCRVFLNEIGMLGRAHVEEARQALAEEVRAENPNRDTVPSQVWTEIKRAALCAGYANAQALVKVDRRASAKNGGYTRYTQSVSRPRLRRLAALTGDASMSLLAQSDVYWDSIERIEYVGEHRVYDLAMPGSHNYVANDILVHNSWLSEHLAAAIAGTSQLIVQGTAGTTEEQIKYSWNYALLIAEGPSRRALVESPILRGMQRGQVVRFEELTRCAAEVQDALISILSEKQIAIPELEEIVPARRGFAIIATANTRDRGVNDMSAALKRRFNFVTVPVIDDVEQEAAIVATRSQELLVDLGVPTDVPRDLVRLLATVFAELRRGQTADGKAKVKSPSTVLSTAELISVVANGGLMGSFFGDGRAGVRDCVASLVGTVAKENASDLDVLREYLETIARPRREGLWPALYQAGQDVLGGV